MPVSQCGSSLVEFLIAGLMGAALMAAMLCTVSTVKANQQAVLNVAAVQQRGRFLSQWLTQQWQRHGTGCLPKRVARVHGYIGGTNRPTGALIGRDWMVLERCDDAGAQVTPVRVRYFVAPDRYRVGRSVLALYQQVGGKRRMRILGGIRQWQLYYWQAVGKRLVRKEAEQVHRWHDVYLVEAVFAWADSPFKSVNSWSVYVSVGR